MLILDPSITSDQDFRALLFTVMDLLFEGSERELFKVCSVFSPFFVPVESRCYFHCYGWTSAQ